MPRAAAGDRFPDLAFETYSGERCTVYEVVRRKIGRASCRERV